ncbi:hypothetical protein ACFPJ1_03330 [Kribbella qitaiheensis]|uniref:hypothetical protein n=1 Tax=Kribbella qitaiheensis TaxID=1544730 RepID=UPI0036069C7D
MRGELRPALPSRRQVLLTGAVMAASAITATQTATGDGYGSGGLGPWRDLDRSISPDEQVRRVVESDGVVMFGDSIAVQDGDPLAWTLAMRTGDALAMHNWSGQPSSAVVDALGRWSREFGLPRRILMATGSNDIFAPPVFGRQVDRAMRIVGWTRTVIWVNVHVDRVKLSPTVREADRRNTAWVNQQLEARARRFPNLRVVHWAEYLAADPARVRNLRDGVHTSVPQGQIARNRLIVDALAAAKTTPPRPQTR